MLGGALEGLLQDLSKALIPAQKRCKQDFASMKWLTCGTSAGVSIEQARRSITATTVAETDVVKSTAKAGHHRRCSSCSSRWSTPLH